MLAAESACVMNGTHDGFWDAVHVDEVIINVGVGKDARDCDCSVNVTAGSPAVVCITQHFVALICLRIFCACHYVAATVGCWGQPVLYFFIHHLFTGTIDASAGRLLQKRLMFVCVGL